MSSKANIRPESVLKLIRRKEVFLKILAKEISDDETIIKVIRDEPHSHLSLVRKEHGLQTHITDELQIAWNRHKGQKMITDERLLQLRLVLFSQPGNPPPRVRSLQNESDRAAVERWIREVLPRVLHAPSSREVMVFRKGPISNLVNAVFSSAPIKEIEFDEIIDANGSTKRLDEDQVFESIRENEMWERSSRLGFVKSPHKLVIALSPELVAEFTLGAITRYEGMLNEAFDLNAFFRDLEERGILPVDIGEPRD